MRRRIGAILASALDLATLLGLFVVIVVVL